MNLARGFVWQIRKGGTVEITHDGKRAASLRGDRAKGFLDDMDALDHQGQQDEMARLTGNYKRGNERLAKHHPRNR